MRKTGERKFKSMRSKKRKGFCGTKVSNKQLKSSSVDREESQDGVDRNHTDVILVDIYKDFIQ